MSKYINYQNIFKPVQLKHNFRGCLMEKEYLLILIPAAFLIAFIILTSGCATKDTGSAPAAQEKAVTDNAAATQQETVETAPSKVGNVPKETLDSLSNIECGDGICNNREYLSTTKTLECRSLLDSCSIDVDGNKVGTENYFICKKDCSADCDLDIDINICLKSDNVYEITTTDRKGNLYNYLLLYRAKVPFMKYGQKGKMTLDLSNVAPVIGQMESISIVPGMMNDDGTVTDCPNHEAVFTSVESC